MPPRGKCSRQLLIQAGAALLMQSRELFYMCKLLSVKNDKCRLCLPVVQIMFALFNHQF